MSRFQQLSAAALVAELRRYADDVQSEGRTHAPECMREAARRIETGTLCSDGPTDDELLTELRSFGPALIMRGLFASIGAAGVAFTTEESGADNFEQTWNELAPEAREGWARIARLVAMCPNLFADTAERVGVLQ